MSMKKNQEKNRFNDFARYSGLAFQMGLIIFAAAFGGLKLDAWLAWKYPVFTVLLTLAGLGIALYQAIGDLLKPPKK